MTLQKATNPCYCPNPEPNLDGVCKICHGFINSRASVNMHTPTTVGLVETVKRSPDRKKKVKR